MECELFAKVRILFRNILAGKVPICAGLLPELLSAVSAEEPVSLKSTTWGYSKILKKNGLQYACQCNSKWGGKNCELDLSKFSWFGNTDSVAFLLPGKFLLIGTFLVDLFQMVFHFGYWFLPLNIKTDVSFSH